MNGTNIDFSEDKTKHLKKIGRLSCHKRRGLGMALWVADNLRAAFGDSKLARLYQCHDYLLFKDYYTEGKIRLSASNSCNLHLLCPLCAITRAAKAVKTYHQKYEALLALKPDLKLTYVVLTVKNGEDLGERFAHVSKSLRKLIDRRRDAIKAKNGSKKQSYALNSVFADVDAGAYSFEVKKGKNSSLWHPHINVLLLSERGIDVEALKAEWHKETKDSFIVYAEEKPAGDKGVFVEIFKYAMKFSEMEYSETYEAYRLLSGKRLFGTFGDFYGLDIDSTPMDEKEDQPYIELFYKYEPKQSKYIQKEREK